MNPPTGQSSTIQFKRGGINHYQVYNANSALLFIRDMVGAAMSVTFNPGTSGNAATGSVQIGQELRTDRSISIGGAGSFGGGVKVLFMSNASTLPTTNPVGGFVSYSEGGYMKVRASDGSIFNTTKQAAITAPTGGTTVDSEARTAISSIISRLQTLGAVA